MSQKPSDEPVRTEQEKKEAAKAFMRGLARLAARMHVEGRFADEDHDQGVRPGRGRQKLANVGPDRKDQAPTSKKRVTRLGGPAVPK
jgi:hypothetical protein